MTDERNDITVNVESFSCDDMGAIQRLSAVKPRPIVRLFGDNHEHFLSQRCVVKDALSESLQQGVELDAARFRRVFAERDADDEVVLYG